MYLYVELWTPKSSWLELSAEERESYFEAVGSDIESLTEEGIEVIGFAINDEGTPQRIDHRYLAAWTMPSEDHAETLEEAVAEAGWYEYFDQINARGELISTEDTFGDMISL